MIIEVYYVTLPLKLNYRFNHAQHMSQNYSIQILRCYWNNPRIRRLNGPQICAGMVPRFTPVTVLVR